MRVMTKGSTRTGPAVRRARLEQQERGGRETAGGWRVLAAKMQLERVTAACHSLPLVPARASRSLPSLARP